MAVANGARRRIGGCDGAGMAIHDHDPPCADFDEGFSHFLNHGGERRDCKRDAARDAGEKILTTKGDSGCNQSIRALQQGGGSDAAGDLLGHQIIAHRQGRAMGFQAAHGQDGDSARRQTRRHFRRGQFRDAMRAHASRSSAARDRAWTPRPMLRSSGW